MGVDMHTRPCGLLKEVGEVFEVVAGDEDARACACRGADRRDLGRPVGGGIRGIEEGEGLHANFAALDQACIIYTPVASIRVRASPTFVSWHERAEGTSGTFSVWVEKLELCNTAHTSTLMTDFARVVRKIPIQNSYYGKSVHLGRDVFGSVLRVSVTVRDEIYTWTKADVLQKRR